MSMPPTANAKRVRELPYQALETEISGIDVYENAIACALSDDLRKEWTEYLEPQEDHHLYHMKGWTRELWLKILGLPAVLPPPEEVRQVETAMGAAQTGKARVDMLPKHPNNPNFTL